MPNINEIVLKPYVAAPVITAGLTLGGALILGSVLAILVMQGKIMHSTFPHSQASRIGTFVGSGIGIGVGIGSVLAPFVILCIAYIKKSSAEAQEKSDTHHHSHDIKKDSGPNKAATSQSTPSTHPLFDEKFTWETVSSSSSIYSRVVATIYSGEILVSFDEDEGTATHFLQKKNGTLLRGYIKVDNYADTYQQYIIDLKSYCQVNKKASKVIDAVAVNNVGWEEWKKMDDILLPLLHTKPVPFLAEDAAWNAQLNIPKHIKVKNLAAAQEYLEITRAKLPK